MTKTAALAAAVALLAAACASSPDPATTIEATSSPDPATTIEATPAGPHGRPKPTPTTPPTR